MALEAARHVSHVCYSNVCCGHPSSKSCLCQQAISSQASLQQGLAEASVSGRLSAAAEHHNCSISRDASPGRTGSPAIRRPPSPECDRMFRFQGHFEAPNNPDLPEQEQQQAAECKQQNITRQGLQALAYHSSSSNSYAVASAVHAASNGQAMLQGTDNLHSTAATGSQQEDALIPVGYGKSKRSDDVQSARSTQQRPESEFRRSHSPEWYDARFKRYVLR